MSVAAERAVAVEPVLQHVRPGPAGLVVTAERGQGHPQVTRRQAVQLVPKPAGRPAIVGHGDDRGQLVGDPAQGRQRR